MPHFSPASKYESFSWIPKLFSGCSPPSLSVLSGSCAAPFLYCLLPAGLTPVLLTLLAKATAAASLYTSPRSFVLVRTAAQGRINVGLMCSFTLYLLWCNCGPELCVSHLLSLPYSSTAAFTLVPVTAWPQRESGHPTHPGQNVPQK